MPIRIVIVILVLMIPFKLFATKLVEERLIVTQRFHWTMVT